TGQGERVIGLPISGRPEQQFEQVIGMFANTIALKTQVTASQSFAEHLGLIKTQLLGAYQHQHFPFERLIENLDLDKDFSRNPLFDTLFVFENGQDRCFETDELTLQPYPVQKDSVAYDLVLEMIEQNGRMSVDFEYNSDLLNADTIVRWQQYFVYLLEQVVAGCAGALCEGTVASYQLWSQAQQQQFLTQVNPPAQSPALSLNLVDLFEQKAAERPDAIAATGQHNEYSYGATAQLSNAIAGRLNASQRVIVYISRSEDYIPLVLGILKAGACFIPVDGKFSAARLALISDDCAPDWIICDSQTIENVPAEYQHKVINKSELLALLPTGTPVVQPVNHSKPTSDAYIIYTSGSTGKPKGVLVAHESVCHTVVWRKQHYNCGYDDRIMQMASFAFDASISEIFSALVSGSAVVFFNESQRLDVPYQLDLIGQKQVTNLLLTSSYYQSMLNFCVDNNQTAKLSQLRFITLAGEAVSESLLQQHFELLPQVILCNEYGPTEDSICSTYHQFTAADHKPYIGKPITNHQLYLLDQDNHLCPPGIHGQIVLAGSGRSKGYLNNEELTNQAFVDMQEKRVYLSGDIGVWNTQGDLLYQGRTDQQVKIRGMRIELNEINFHLKAVDGIKDAVVLPQDQLLVAYYIAELNQTVSEDKVQQQLTAILPRYMVPECYVAMKAFPTNNNGKIDKKNFPLPQVVSTPTVVRTQMSDKETVIAKIWCEVLNKDNIGVTDNYFKLGGDSIKGIQVVSRLNKA
ncbi:MAG: amino acid adenylation domain-containing protein, partial [Psychrosphaera sp.]|nr:amino acid adenylation domain-containing protein [Psychrosphaera sp.]